MGYLLIGGLFCVERSPGFAGFTTLSTAASNRSQASGARSIGSSSLTVGFPAIANPWDIIAPPTGDDTRTITAAAKGEASSQWELTEVFPGYLFSALGGGWPCDGVAARAYGLPLNFKERLNGLERVGEAYFRSHPNQSAEADLEAVIHAARMLSLRRNEIVHSIIHGLQYERSARIEADTFTAVFKFRFFVVPPAYTDRKWDERSQPSFIHAAAEMDACCEAFADLGVNAFNLAMQVSGYDEWPASPQTRLLQRSGPCTARRQEHRPEFLLQP